MPYAVTNRRVFWISGMIVIFSITLQGCATSRIAKSQTPASSQNRAQMMNRWENVAALVSGMSLRVGLTDGTRIAGTFQSVSPDQLVIQTEGDQGSVTWRRDQVTRVEQRRGPRLRSGVGWGALVGAVVGAILLGTIEPLDAATNGVLGYHEIPVLAITTAIGTGTGFAINAARRRWVVVYQNP